MTYAGPHDIGSRPRTERGTQSIVTKSTDAIGTSGRALRAYKQADPDLSAVRRDSTVVRARERCGRVPIKRRIPPLTAAGAVSAPRSFM